MNWVWASSVSGRNKSTDSFSAKKDCSCLTVVCVCIDGYTDSVYNPDHLQGLHEEPTHW